MKNKGFTLIELLVTMGIIAVLAGMAVFNFNQSRMRARDVSRKNDLGQLVNAFELYKNDNGEYPEDLDFQQTLLDAGYTKVTFVDPKGSEWATYDYAPVANANGRLTTYNIMACLENAADNVRATDSVCSSAFNNFQGPGRECWCGTNYAGRMYIVSNP